MVDPLFNLAVLGVISIAGFLLIDLILIPRCRDMFIRAGLSGMDMSKKEKIRIPEAQGVLCGTVYLLILFCSIPIAFWGPTPQGQLLEYMSALSTIGFMIFLGFADDVLNLPWRVKLILPTAASIPLLTVYAVNFNSTTIIVPKPLRSLLGFDVNLGPLYYVYMAMLAVFCTNAVNIYAGVNGLEAGQSIIIALSIFAFNLCEITGINWEGHLLSMYLILPYLFVSLALVKHNWYPSAVFVGDTFCYFSGMTFAVVGILGHFSKTMLLFFIPQIINFLYSTPQLFRLVPCPRHRLPRYNPDSDTVSPSTTEFRMSSLPWLGQIIVQLCSKLRLVSCHPVSSCDKSEKKARDSKDEKTELLECNNLTLINFLLLLTGPLHERTLVIILLSIQVVCTGIAFCIRYPLGNFFYGS